MYDGEGPLLKSIPLFMNESLELLALYDIGVDAEMMRRPATLRAVGALQCPHTFASSFVVVCIYQHSMCPTDIECTSEGYAARRDRQESLLGLYI